MWENPDMITFVTEEGRDDPPDPNLEIQAMPYERALSELEAIVKSLEAGQLSLEESMLAFRRGNLLFAHCQSRLNEAEQQIRILENGRLRDLELGAERQA